MWGSRQVQISNGSHRVDQNAYPQTVNLTTLEIKDGHLKAPYF